MGTWRNRQLRGLPQAAVRYLNKPLAATTDDEFIGLAAMIKASNQVNPVSHRDVYVARVARVRALVLGQCRPAGWFDTALEHCSGKPAIPFDFRAGSRSADWRTQLLV